MNFDDQLKITNFSTSAALLITFLLALRLDNIFITIVGTLLASFLMFFLSGANIIYVIQKFFRHNIDLSTYVVLSLVASFFFAPAVLLLIYTLLGYIGPWIALTVYIAFCFLPVAWDLISERFPNVFNNKPIQLSLPKASWQEIIRHPLFLGLVVVAGVHLYNVSRYSFLAVLDPYSWLISFEKVISTGKLNSINDGDRPLYTVLITTFHYLSTASFYTITKYLFPFFSVAAVPPLWLAARRLSRPLQYIFLCAALASPVIIFEFEIVRQQILALLYMYFVIGLTVEFTRSQDRVVFYILGLSSLIGSLYHPLFFMVFLIWVAVALIINRYVIWNHKLQTVVALVLLIPWYEKLQIAPIVHSLGFLGKRLVLRFISGNQNWRFPAYYVNIDQNPVGWAGFSGVVKYYGFYVGPLSAAILAISLTFLLSSEKLRKFAYTKIQSIAYLIPIGLIAFFLFVAEIAPRTSNVAYLPDRAWQILSIILLFPLLGIFVYLDKHKTKYRVGRLVITLTVVASVIINILGAGYVIYLNGFTVPDYERRAATWITQNLPKDRIIFSTSSKNLLRFHTKSTRIYLEQEYFSITDSNLLVDHLVTLLQFHNNPSPPLNALGITEKANENTNKSPTTDSNNPDTSYDNVSICYPGYVDYIEQKIAVECAPEPSATPKPSVQPTPLVIPLAQAAKPIYLYYAHTHPKNPYISRPYKSSFTGSRQEVTFPAIDNNPNIFEKVYEDENNVFIWRVHLNRVGAPVQ